MAAMKRFVLALALLIGLFFPDISGAQVQEALAAFASPNVGRARPALSYRLLVMPSEPVAGQATTFETIRQALALSIPLWQNASDELTFQGSVNAHVIETGAILPTTGDPFPHNLTDVRFGPTWRHRFRNAWITGLSVQMGSASDVPFGRYDDSELMANWFLRIPSGGKNAWVVFLNYSNNRDFANHIPLPGFGYAIAENRWCTGLLGVPVVAITLLPREKVNLSLNYLPLLHVNADLGYEPAPQLRLFAAFKWSNEIYFRNAQPDSALRLFLVDKRISGGMRLRPARWAEVQLAGGWSFDRMAFESRAVYKDRDYNRLDFGAGPFASLELRVRMTGREAEGPPPGGPQIQR